MSVAMRTMGTVMTASLPRPTKTFGQTLRECRERRNIPIRVLAHKLKVNRSDIHDWERGKAKIPHNAFAKLCIVMQEMSVWKHMPDIFADQEERPIPEVIAQPEPPKPAPVPTVEEKEPDSGPLGPTTHPPDPPKTFAEALQRTRESEKVLRHTVAELCQVTTKTVKTWESGISLPTHKNYERLLGIFPSLKNAPRPAWPVVAEPGSFGARLREAREKAGLKQGELAALIGADNTTISKWEVGEQHPSNESMVKILDVFPELAPTAPPIVAPVAVSDRKPFGETLRKLRAAAGMTIERLAEQMGVTDKAVGQWELDNNIPVREHYEKLIFLFPSLREAKYPCPRDIPKPDGRSGEKSEPSEVPMMPAPKPIALAPSSQPSPQDWIGLLVKVRAVEAGGKEATVTLLRDAVRLGVTAADLLKMISPEE